MMQWLLLRSALLTIFAAADEHIVLPPVSTNASLPEKMLLFIPGGKVPNHHYGPTAQAIQKAAAHDLRLWVVVPTVFQNLCIISCSTTGLCAPLHGTVEDALAVAKQKGWKRGKDEEDMWLAGHSLGGVCANTLFQAYSSSSSLPYAGVVVMGSYVDETGDHDVTHYPKPVLTLNVELDGGLARPGKTATWWRQHLALSIAKGEEHALTQKPVVILPGLNHSDFCPGFDVPGDLPAEIDQATATATIGEVVAAFLRLQVAPPSSDVRATALDFMRAQVAWTREFMAPYLKAQEWERNRTDVVDSAEGASPFCARAQHIVAGLLKEDDVRLHVRDGFHVDSSNLEHCHPNWTVSAEGLAVNSCSHADYYLDVANTGSITAASEIACKMLSSDRVAQQLKTKAEDPKVPCKDGNRYSVELAETLAAKRTLERFKRIGRGWCFAEDSPTLGNVGPLWVFHDALTLNENATCMAVSSPVLKTEIDGKIYPGNHYCKFLSPARVLDWMMTDGIKKFSATDDTSKSKSKPSKDARVDIIV